VKSLKKVLVVSGSSRANNNSLKVSHHFAKYSSEIFDVQIFDGRMLNIFDQSRDEIETVLATFRKKMHQTDGIILTTPEYNGSYSYLIKILLDHLSYPCEMKAKPCSILGVATGKIGAIKAIEHLQSLCLSMGGICMPDPVSIGEVHHLVDKTKMDMSEKADYLKPLYGKICEGFVDFFTGR